MKTLKQGLDRFLATVCIIDFIGMVLLTVYQVIMRYVFKSPSSVIASCGSSFCPLPADSVRETISASPF